MQLQPQASHTISRQIPDWTDATTYYVQAVVRNASTDALIATVQLTSRGGQRYSKDWQVPADPSGQGFYISIVTSVYTDSGYTAKSGNYGDDENTYLVQDRLIGRNGAGGGVDAYTVRQIVAEEVAKAAPNFAPITGAIGVLQREINRIPKEDGASPRWDEVLAAIEGVKEAIEPFPTIPESDDGPVLEAIQGVRDALLAKMPKLDLEPVLTKLADMTGDDEVDQEELLGAVKDLAAKVGIVFDTHAAENNAGDALLRRLLLGLATASKQPEATPSPLDLTKLAGKS